MIDEPRIKRCAVSDKPVESSLMSEYYLFRQIPVLLRGESATMVGKPGVWSWSDVNPGTAALIDVMELDQGDHVLDLGCGTGLIGLTAARLAYAGRTTLVDVNIAAVACARRTLAANSVNNATVQLDNGTDGVADYDVVLSHLPRGRAVIEGLIRDAVRALKPGGRFYLVAHKRAGLKRAVAYAAERLGRAAVVRQKQGYHVALAIKGREQAIVDAQDAFHEYAIDVNGEMTRLVSCPGVFAWDRLDDGTAALIQAMQVRSGASVLDLGCGTGLVALAAARRGAQVTAVDADVRAVDSAERTLSANGFDVEVMISDCAEAVRNRQFDTVLCNPPFHQGVGVEYEVARQMVRDASGLLRPGGRLYLVSNAFIRYERETGGRFTRVEEIFNDRRYRVLQAIR
jgi:16S rRNA (guanine1207-N2)-methyltransferase